MKNLTAIIISLTILLLLFFILPNIFIRQRLDSSVEESIGTFSLATNTPLIFSFTPRHQIINQIDLQLKNPNLSNHSLITAKITSTNYEFESSFTGFNVGDPSWVSLKIPPLNSTNSVVKITLSTDNSTPETLFSILNSTNQPNYRAYYKTTISDNISVQIKLFLARNRFFTAIYLFIIIFLNIIYIRFHENNKK